MAEEIVQGRVGVLEQAVGRLVEDVRSNFVVQTQKGLVESYPPEEQIRDVIVGTAAQALDMQFEANGSGLCVNSARGGISVVGAPVANRVFDIFSQVSSDPMELPSALTDCFVRVSEKYGLNLDALAQALDEVEFYVPVGLGNDGLTRENDAFFSPGLTI